MNRLYRLLEHLKRAVDFEDVLLILLGAFLVFVLVPLFLIPKTGCSYRTSVLFGPLICLAAVTWEAVECRLVTSRSFLLFISALGDLKERSAIIAATRGKLESHLWFWSQLLRSIGPFAWAWVKRVALGSFRRIA